MAFSLNAGSLDWLYIESMSGGPLLFPSYLRQDCLVHLNKPKKAVQFGEDSFVSYIQLLKSEWIKGGLLVVCLLELRILDCAISKLALNTNFKKF